MERRLEHRFQPNQGVTLKVLSMRPGPVIQASALDVSGSGMRLRSSLPVPCGVQVEIETDELTSLGEICRCEPDQQSHYTVGVQLFETVASLAKQNSLKSRSRGA